MSNRQFGALVALALLFAACSAGPGTGGQLEGTQWVLDSYDQAGTLTILPETLYADANFDAYRVSGFSGCNEFDALYRAGGRTLNITQPSGTLVACDEPTMTFEQTYNTLLQQGRFYSVRRDTLTMFDTGGNTVLVFDAAPRNALLGKWLVDSYGTNPGTVVAVQSDTQIDLVFGIASVGGFSGCNSFSGTYGTNGNVVRVSRLATTRLVCAPEVMDQETAFLGALQGASLIESRGSQLNLTDRSGRLLVALVRPSAVEPSPSPAASPSPTVTPKPTPTSSPTPTPSPKSTPTPTASPTAKPTASPTPKPAATPTAKPTASPKPSPKPTASTKPTASPKPSSKPTASPPVTIPSTASCKLIGNGGTVATIVYPGSWSTVTEPAELACRYFDPAPITVPADPSTLETAVMAGLSPTPYAEAIAAATDPLAWTVNTRSETNVQGAAVTCIGAIAASDAAGIPVGTARYACLANVQAAGTVVIDATGTPGDGAYAAEAAVVTLMTLASTFTPPG